VPPAAAAAKRRPRGAAVGAAGQVRPKGTLSHREPCPPLSPLPTAYHARAERAPQPTMHVLSAPHSPPCTC